MSRILGVNQKTTWKLRHTIRELMNDREMIAGRLSGVVEIDECFVGGVPKFKKVRKNKRGRGTKEPMVLFAANRNGQAKAIGPNHRHTGLPRDSGRTWKPQT